MFFIPESSNTQNKTKLRQAQQQTYFVSISLIESFLKQFIHKYKWVETTPRWQHQSLLTCPPPMDAQLYTGPFFSERNPETSWATPTHWVAEKVPKSKWVGKAEIHSLHKSHPRKMFYDHEGILNSQFFPEEWRVWTTYIAPQLLRLPPELWAPKLPSSESQQDLIHKSHRTTANKETVVK